MNFYNQMNGQAGYGGGNPYAQQAQTSLQNAQQNPNSQLTPQQISAIMTMRAAMQSPNSPSPQAPNAGTPQGQGGGMTPQQMTALQAQSRPPQAPPGTPQMPGSPPPGSPPGAPTSAPPMLPPGAMPQGMPPGAPPGAAPGAGAPPGSPPSGMNPQMMQMLQAKMASMGGGGNPNMGAAFSQMRGQMPSWMNGLGIFGGQQ